MIVCSPIAARHGNASRLRDGERSAQCAGGKRALHFGSIHRHKKASSWAWVFCQLAVPAGWS